MPATDSAHALAQSLLLLIPRSPESLRRACVLLLNPPLGESKVLPVTIQYRTVNLTVNGKVRAWGPYVADEIPGHTGQSIEGEPPQGVPAHREGKREHDTFHHVHYME